MERTDGLPPGPVPHDALPLPDYDHLPLPSLVHRVRTLDAAGVATVLRYECDHANRAAVVDTLQHRLAELRGGASPSPGSATAAAPEAPPAPAGDLAVSPATAGPAMNPPSHGNPTNPAQPRPTG